MSRYNPHHDVEPVLDAASRWIQRCLVEDGSVLSERPLWTEQCIEETHAAYVEHPDEGDAGFYDKLHNQLESASSDAKCLMAESLWVLMLFQSNIGAEKKRESIALVWGWSGRALNEGQPMLSDSVLQGIGSPGTAYNTHRWRELVYFLGLILNIKRKPAETRARLFESRELFEQWLDEIPQEGTRQFPHIFRYLAFPDYYERITLKRDRHKILEAFTDLKPSAIEAMPDIELEAALHSLRERLEQQHNTSDLDFYVSPLIEHWQDRDDPTDAENAPTPSEHADGHRVMDEARDGYGSRVKPALNRIFFGPPGTGKTYDTVVEAIRILDPALLDESDSKAERVSIKARFDELVAAKRIRFVTFHQSFSYEDFVEGLRADNGEDGSLQYRIESGVFKSLCDDARGAAQVGHDVGIREGARIWKLSIDGTGASATRDYCLAQNEARIGWGDVGDLRDENLADRPEYQALGFNDKNTLQAFSSEMLPGDIILCIGSATTVQAIGVVQDEYIYQAEPPPGVRNDYRNVLPVQWLAAGLNLDLQSLNGGVRFTLKTVYEISRFNWPELSSLLESRGIKLKGARKGSERPAPDHVLIIDEINRGNVSRIFGELITLIEPSKRVGARDHLQIVLPYSKKLFDVPGNVYLIGTMNTADRSLAGMDVALRRRFEFVEKPARPALLQGRVVDGIELAPMLQAMNDRIEALLDRDHHIGHAYFMDLDGSSSLADLATIFRHKILPLLQEYFFEDWEKIRWVLNDHRKPEDHSFIVSHGRSKAALFGDESGAPVNAKLWKVNEQAFNEPGSYAGIAQFQGG